MDGEVRIEAESDIVVVRRVVREAATLLGFRGTDVTRIVTSASELARNVVVHGGGAGVMRWRQLKQRGKVALELAFEDRGPGIRDVAQVLAPGFTTGRGLGMGLSGAKRLMGELEIESEPGWGTTVTVRKWRGAR